MRDAIRELAPLIALAAWFGLILLAVEISDAYATWSAVRRQRRWAERILRESAPRMRGKEEV